MFQRPGRGRRAATAAALGLALPVLAGCGLEAKDVTSHEHATIQAADYRMGPMRIRDAFITTPLAGTPSSSGGTTNAYLVVTIVNNGPADQLLGISTTIGVGTIQGGTITLPSGVVVAISDPDIDASAPSIAISGKTPTVGTTVPVQFNFAKAGMTQEIQVPVVSPDGLSTSPTQVVPPEQATPPVENAPSASD